MTGRIRGKSEETSKRFEEASKSLKRLLRKVLLVALRDKFSSCESRHFGVSRSYLLASRITVL
jgi:hypothetical protein